MTILVLSENFPPRTGGSGRWLWELYRRFPREQVMVAAGEHPLAEDFDRTHDVRVKRIPLAFGTWGMATPRGMLGYSRALRRVRRLVRSHGIEQIHCGCMLPEGWIAWMLRRLGGPRYVCFVHGEELNIAASSRELSWLARRVLAGAELVIANSSNTATLLREQWPVQAEGLRVLHPGVDANIFVPAERDEDVRSQMGWAGRTVILTVGRLQKRKGHDMLIRSLPRIAERVPDVLYAIVGDGAERDRLQQLAAECGVRHRVQFFGELSDERLVRCYQQCDLFVLPNRTIAGDFEGFGMVLVEAQACGKPVVAGNSGGTAETLYAGVTGLVTDAADVLELSAAVHTLLGDKCLRKRMGTMARAWAVEHYDWQSLVSQAHQFSHLPLSTSRVGIDTVCS